MMKQMKFFIDEEAKATLERLKVAGGHQSLAETIQNAIGFYEWARVHIQNGRRIGVIAADQSVVSEVDLPFQKK